MHARVTITQGPPEKGDEAIRYVREHIIPAIQKQWGFEGGYWLADRASGKGMVMTLWESAEAEQASADMAAQARARASAMLGAEVKSVDVYEVLDQVSGPEAPPARARATTRRAARGRPRKAGRRRRA